MSLELQRAGFNPQSVRCERHAPLAADPSGAAPAEQETCLALIPHWSIMAWAHGSSGLVVFGSRPRAPMGRNLRRAEVEPEVAPHGKPHLEPDMEGG
jgi:hypothetical protein